MILKNPIILLEIHYNVTALSLSTSAIPKNLTLTDDGYIVCETSIKMLKDGNQYFDGFLKQKFICRFCDSENDPTRLIK
ncbi:hypothetical protein V7D15_00605 [Thermoanaerobacter thermohydrosulfuricus]|uniref:hypothetical protein n=1 Tax=Thermoanaerobacter indiensis TaxID=1125974 RepID=UPI0003A27CF2|nr:hypothetical protein [Thermoanaerobacter indiensis]